MIEPKYKAWHKTWSAEKVDETDWHSPGQRINGLVLVKGLWQGNSGVRHVDLWGWGSACLLKEVELVKFTGAKDHRKTEIYEGDIFGRLGGDREKPNDYEVHGIVVWDEDLYAFTVNETNGGWNYLHKYLSENRFSSEIIGNKFENPELLSNS